MGCKKVKRKRRKKNFDGAFSLAVFSISGDKKGGKSKWFCFFS